MILWKLQSKHIWVCRRKYCSSICSLFFFFFLLPSAMFLLPASGLVWAQKTPQQISSSFSCGSDIKGAGREQGTAEERTHRTANAGISVEEVDGFQGKTWNEIKMRQMQELYKRQGSWDWGKLCLIIIKDMPIRNHYDFSLKCLF